MSKKSGRQETAEKHVKDVKQRTRWKFSGEEKIRIVLEGLRGEYSIAELCRREGIAQGLYYTWSKEFLEAQIDAFVGHYNHRRYHENLKNLTPADVYTGRGQTILLEREKTQNEDHETKALAARPIGCITQTQMS